MLALILMTLGCARTNILPLTLRGITHWAADAEEEEEEEEDFA